MIKLLFITILYSTIACKIFAGDVDDLFNDILKKDGDDYIQLRKQILSQPSIRDYLHNKLGDNNINDYIKLNAKILLEHFENKETINMFLSSPWLENPDMLKYLDKYKELSNVRDPSGIKYLMPLLKEQMLKQHFINYAEHYKLKYIFIEGMIKKLSYQGIKYFPVEETGLPGEINRLSFQSETKSIRLADSYLTDRNNFLLKFSFYYVALLKTGNDKLILPVILNDIKESKSNANIEYIIYYNERQYFPVLLEYCLNIHRIIPLTQLLCLADKNDIGIINNYIDKIDWAINDDAIKKFYDPDYLKKLSASEYKELCNKHNIGNITRDNYKKAIDEYTKCTEADMKKYEEWRNEFGFALKSLYPDFSQLDASLNRYRERIKQQDDDIKEWKRICKTLPGIENYDINCPIANSIEYIPLDKRNIEELRLMLKNINNSENEWIKGALRANIENIKANITNAIGKIDLRNVKEYLSKKIPDFQEIEEAYLNTIEYQEDLNNAKTITEKQKILSRLNKLSYPTYYAMNKDALKKCVAIMDNEKLIWQDNEYLINIYNTIKKTLDKKE